MFKDATLMFKESKLGFCPTVTVAEAGEHNMGSAEGFPLVGVRVGSDGTVGVGVVGTWVGLSTFHNETNGPRNATP